MDEKSLAFLNLVSKCNGSIKKAREIVANSTKLAKEESPAKEEKKNYGKKEDKKED